MTENAGEDADRAVKETTEEEKKAGQDPLTEPLRTLLLRAVGSTGSCDPAETLPMIEEDLTSAEFRQAEAFLAWCHTTGHRFGHSNIHIRWADWQHNIGTRV